MDTKRESGERPAPGAVPGGPGIAVTPQTLDGVRERNPQALATFFEAYFDRIYGLAYRLLGNPEAAEDVAQVVFQKVHRAAHQLDSARDPLPWLLTITHNACRDVWRSRAYKLARNSRSLEDTEGLADSLPSPAANPEEASLLRERAQLVQAAILDLPEDLKAVVVLHDYQGLGHEEIAGMLGTTHAAVRKRYSRALGRLAKTLKEIV